MCSRQGSKVWLLWGGKCTQVYKISVVYIISQFWYVQKEIHAFHTLSFSASLLNVLWTTELQIQTNWIWAMEFESPLLCPFNAVISLRCVISISIQHKASNQLHRVKLTERSVSWNERTWKSAYCLQHQMNKFQMQTESFCQSHFLGDWQDSLYLYENANTTLLLVLIILFFTTTVQRQILSECGLWTICLSSIKIFSILQIGHANNTKFNPKKIWGMFHLFILVGQTE